MLENNQIDDDMLDAVSGGTEIPHRSTKNEQLEYELKSLEQQLAAGGLSPAEKVRITMRIFEIKNELKSYER